MQAWWAPLVSPATEAAQLTRKRIRHVPFVFYLPSTSLQQTMSGESPSRREHKHRDREGERDREHRHRRSPAVSHVLLSALPTSWHLSSTTCQEQLPCVLQGFPRSNQAQGAQGACSRPRQRQ